MKIRLLLLSFSFVLTIKPFEEIPLSIEDAIHSLQAPEYRSQKFSTEFKPLLELYNTNNPVHALKLIYDYKLQKYFDWAEYLHKKFPYLPLEVFQEGYVLLTEKNEYFPFAIREIFLINNNKLSKAIQENNITKTFLLLLLGADKNGKDSKGLTPLMNAMKQNNKDIVQLLTDVGAIDAELIAMRLKQQPKRTDLKGYISKRLPAQSEKGLKGILPHEKKWWEYWK